jgi:hypothetical protein
MVGRAMCLHDYIVQKRKKKDLLAYLGGELTIGDTEPLDIPVLFPLFLL